MMHRPILLLALVAPALLAAASAPVVPERESVEQQLARTAAEAREAERRLAAFEASERKASSEAEQLAAERRSAAAAIALAEARIAQSESALSKARADVLLRERRLARRRAPLAALLAGIASIGRRPPILSLADGASVTEVVRVRALIDATMPVIARRSAALQAELAEGRAFAARAEAATADIAERRAELETRQRRFAELEAKALDRADELRRSAFGEQDRVMAGGEQLLDLKGRAGAAAAARAEARKLAAMPLAPPRPFPADGARPAATLAYRLPTDAAVIEGLGEVSPAGIRSRGIRFATAQGAAIVAPAPGTILFAGAFRRHDGILVIDHGKGWTTLLVGVSPSVRRGQRVEAGAPIGRALGDVALELRSSGEPRSAALIAGSSDMLSNGAETR